MGSGMMIGAGAFDATADVSSTALRIMAEADVAVQRSSNYDDTNDEYASSSITFSSLTIDDIPVMFVSDSPDENGSLVIQTAVGIGGGSGQSVNFASPNPLQINNRGDTNHEVGFQYSTYGGDVDGADITEQDVQEIFEFTDSSGNVISPDHTGGGSDPNTLVTVNSGTTEQVTLTVDTTNHVSDLQGKATTSGADPFNGDTSPIELLDQITLVTNEV